MATTLRAGRVRPWALAVFCGGAAALLAWDLSPWLGLPVGAIAFLVVRRRLREGLPPLSEDVRRLVSVRAWVVLVLLVAIVIWLLIWVPGRMW